MASRQLFFLNFLNAVYHFEKETPFDSPKEVIEV